MKNILYLFLFLLFSCNGGVNPEPKDNTEIAYTYFEESTENFVNPERGFYRYSATRASQYQNLSLNTLVRNRDETSSSGATYATFNSLVFRYFILDSFTNAPISESFLADLQEDFDIAREAGVKLIPRFTYTTTASPGDCAEGFICPPYGDAPKSRVLEHIAQIGPVLGENADVILTVQMGFIGVWGENYYTDYFGDASPNSNQGKLLDENWSDRIEVLIALLEALPGELTVQVRYPQFKQRAVYGIDANTKVASLSLSEAFGGSYKARIGFHNDCLFASSDDFGTYVDYGNSSTPRRTDIGNLKNYFAEDSKYGIVGGETCSDGYSPRNDCSPIGVADEDLRLLHYTYLNADYNNEVNNDWVDGGCMEDIKRNMGYRIVLDSAQLPSEKKASETFDVKFHFRNIGYAAPTRERSVYLILVNESSAAEIRLPFETDIRLWHDQVDLIQSFDIPEGTPAGNYDLMISLPDIHESIADRPEYAIRLANTEMWEEQSGYNNLNLQVTIQ
ncbi:MAG: hypothetical protein ACJA08_000042 [Cyclobacteriaceae bacterium]|jgi:hypothetical protein